VSAKSEQQEREREREEERRRVGGARRQEKRCRKVSSWRGWPPRAFLMDNNRDISPHLGESPPATG